MSYWIDRGDANRPDQQNFSLREQVNQAIEDQLTSLRANLDGRWAFPIRTNPETAVRGWERVIVVCSPESKESCRDVSLVAQVGQPVTLQFPKCHFPDGTAATITLPPLSSEGSIDLYSGSSYITPRERLTPHNVYGVAPGPQYAKDLVLLLCVATQGENLIETVGITTVALPRNWRKAFPPDPSEAGRTGGGRPRHKHRIIREPVTSEEKPPEVPPLTWETMKGIVDELSLSKEEPTGWREKRFGRLGGKAATDVRVLAKTGELQIEFWGLDVARLSSLARGTWKDLLGCFSAQGFCDRTTGKLVFSVKKTEEGIAVAVAITDYNGKQGINLSEANPRLNQEESLAILMRRVEPLVKELPRERTYDGRRRRR